MGAAQPMEGPAKVRPLFHRVDSLRILGAMAVAGYHFGDMAVHGVPLLPDRPWPGTAAWPKVVLRASEVLLPAHAALMMFFVISGLVLRLALEYGPQTVGRASAKFLVGRAFRIYPIVIVGVIVTALAVGGMVGNLQPRPLTLPLFLKNILLLDATVNNNYWALQVEILMVPIMLAVYFLERRFGPAIVLAIGVTTACLSFSGRWAIWAPLSHNAFAFVLGMALPTFGRRLALKVSRRSATLWLIAAIAVLLLTRPTFGLYARVSAFFEGWAALVLVSMAAFRPDVSLLAFLDAKLLRRAGLAAGSYYVLHTATFGVALLVAHLLIPLAWSSQVPSLVAALVVSVWLAALLPLAMLTYRLIEVPGIEMGRRLTRWLRLDSQSRKVSVTHVAAEGCAA